MIALALVGVAMAGAGDVPAPVLGPVPVPGECPRSYAVRAGWQMPAEVVTTEGTAACGGVIIPTSQAAYLLGLEADVPLHLADIELLKAERAELVAELAERRSPWLYRAEGAGVIGLVAVGMAAGWYAGTSGGGP